MNNDKSNANGEERVLTLLHLLGADVAEQVIEQLDSPLPDRLRRGLSDFSTRLPSVRRQQQVIEEFERFFHFVVKSQPASLRLHDPDEDEDEVEKAPPPRVYTPSGDALIDLERMNQYQLAAALEEEQPRTVALLLKVVSAKRVAQLLNLISDEKREQIVQEMSRDPRAPEIILRRIAATTVERAIKLSPEPPKNEDPVRRMVDVLRATDKPKRRQILKVLEDQNPDQAAEINVALYQFDDLATLDDQQVQKVLARVDSSTLSTALFQADEAIVEKILGNLSKRARSALQEELSFQRNVSSSQRTAARQLVVQAIAEAEQEME